MCSCPTASKEPIIASSGRWSSQLMSADRSALLRRPRGIRHAGIRDIVRVEPGVADPALLVIVCHALVRERDHLVVGAGRARVEQRLDANILVIARVVDLIEL